MPSWLLPALVIGLVASGLVVAGAISLSTVLYAGMLGGMLLMHKGGHGGHGGHGSAIRPEEDDLSRASGEAQPGGTSSSRRLDERALTNPDGSEIRNHDQHHNDACH